MSNRWLKIDWKVCLGLMTLGTLFFANTGLSQNIPAKNQAGQAEIDMDSSAQVDKNVIFDASQSLVSGDPTQTVYHWDFGDGTQKSGINVTHTYNSTGTYHVILDISNKQQTLSAEADIFIYKKSLLLLTDQSDKKSEVENLKNIAQNDGIELNVLESFDSASEFISEEDLSKQMGENLSALERSDAIVLWTQDSVGLDALNRLVKENSNLKLENLDEKNLYIIDEDPTKDFTTSLAILNPRQIIVAKEASLYVIIPTPENGVVHALQQGGYEFEFIDEASRRLSLWNFMTYFTNFLVESGIPSDTILLILLLPVIATIVVFMRQVLGMDTFGMYTPVILCLTFLILGLKFGLITLITALAVGMATRYALKKVHLLFMPKLAIVMFMITLSLFALLILGTFYQLFDSEFFSLAIFPMLILGSITEKFTSIQTEAGFWKTIWLTVQTVIIAIVAYIVVGGQVDLGFLSFQWDALRNFIGHYPETIFIFLILNILLGRWTGLRLVEYIRFREVFQHNEEE